ncbi:hypothetical protein IQ260_06070 [Leptolyngbya cf. ectocarpi LEGE 11479]|uniref:Uncharacterized protein n=1 Tax=Leptolyngbya cf. ectocarpi LEGE 11479 TaxID=1828722 RepID=A0A928X277_LEPEC|nr:hypothetical protein [Leptolyngbya ectocarpi]MBE9066214.1 hypothetical protein [Leptolyngbya cf. ectocarpi LEGE 11479]
MYNFKLRQAAISLSFSTISALFVGSADVAIATHKGITLNSSSLDGHSDNGQPHKGIRMNSTSLDGQADKGLTCND